MTRSPEIQSCLSAKRMECRNRNVHHCVVPAADGKRKHTLMRWSCCSLAGKYWKRSFIIGGIFALLLLIQTKLAGGKGRELFQNAGCLQREGSTLIASYSEGPTRTICITLDVVAPVAVYLKASPPGVHSTRAQRPNSQGGRKCSASLPLPPLPTAGAAQPVPVQPRSCCRSKFAIKEN